MDLTDILVIIAFFAMLWFLIFGFFYVISLAEDLWTTECNSLCKQRDYSFIRLESNTGCICLNDNNEEVYLRHG